MLTARGPNSVLVPSCGTSVHLLFFGGSNKQTVSPTTLDLPDMAEESHECWLTISNQSVLGPDTSWTAVFDTLVCLSLVDLRDIAAPACGAV